MSHFVLLCEQGNAALFATEGSTYTVGPVATTIYPVSGSAVDYTYDVLGVKYSYTIELRPTDEDDDINFVLPPDQILPTSREMWAFHTAVAEALIEEFPRA